MPELQRTGQCDVGSVTSEALVRSHDGMNFGAASAASWQVRGRSGRSSLETRSEPRGLDNRHPHRRRARRSGEFGLIPILLSSWPSFYEGVGCQAPRRFPIVRASSRRSGLLPSREAAEAAPITSTSVERTSRCLHTGRSVRSQAWARPPSIRGDARSHTSCTHALDRRARRSICKTVPAGTRRAIERRAPVWADGARPSVG